MFLLTKREYTNYLNHLLELFTRKYTRNKMSAKKYHRLYMKLFAWERLYYLRYDQYFIDWDEDDDDDW